MYSKITGTGSGSAPVVNLTFPFIDKSHVQARAGGVPVTFTWTGASQITFDAAVATGATWEVLRQTPRDERLVDFTNEAVLTEADLDLNANQLFYLSQELADNNIIVAVSTGRTYVDDLDGVVLGAVSSAQRDLNSTTINAALATGARLFMRPGIRLEIGSSLILASGAGLIGEPGGAKPKIYMPAAKFTNTNNTVVDGTWAPNTRYGSNAVGINFSGQLGSPFTPVTDIHLENFELESEVAIGRYLRGIVGMNVQNVRIRNVEVHGLPIGVGIVISSASDVQIVDAYIHDFNDTTDWATLPQLTGIEIDNDTFNGVASTDITIVRPRVENLTVSGALLTHWGYQTDGINVAHVTSRVNILSPRIKNVGEGIDFFGSDSLISDVEITDAYQYGLKFIHGASRNVVSGANVINVGIAGLAFMGSSVVAQDTAGNIVNGLAVSTLDPNDAWAASDTACVLFDNNGGATGKPRDNTVNGATLLTGANGEYGWLDRSSGSGNYGDNVGATLGVSGQRKVLVTSAAGSVRMKGSTTYETEVA